MGGYKDAKGPAGWSLSLQSYRSTFFGVSLPDIPFLSIVHSFLHDCVVFYYFLLKHYTGQDQFVSLQPFRIFIMLSSPLLILLVSAGIIEASPVHDPGHTLSHLRLRASSDSSTGLTLLADAVQQGSFNNGRDEIGANEVGQALSATSQNNFINNCAGKTLTNGLQITTGSCNGISTSATSNFKTNTDFASYG